MAISYNAADYIDKSTVLNACDNIDEKAKDYRFMYKAIDEAADFFKKDVLSVEGNTIDVPLKEQAIGIRDYEIQINNLTDEIRAMVNQAYDKLQDKLNNQKAVDEAERARQEAEASNNK